MKTKAILVIDRMPNTCDECEYCGYAIVGEGEDEYKYRSCCLSQRYLGEIAEDSKDSLCPLKPLPQKKEVEVNKIEDLMHTEFSIEDIYTNKYIATIRLATDKLISLGWNACLKEITK